MIITEMDEFLNVCKEKLVEQYNKKVLEANPLICQEIDIKDVYVVWSCKTLQNFKALLSTNVVGDNTYVEYTYDGDKQRLYEDFYRKISNRCINE